MSMDQFYTKAVLLAVRLILGLETVTYSCKYNDNGRNYGNARIKATARGGYHLDRYK